jgi:DNA-binding CsgD family transcriptional regulator
MSAVPDRKQCVWQVVATDDRARGEMEAWVRRGGYLLLKDVHVVKGEQLGTVTAVIVITPRELDTLQALAAHDEVPAIAEAMHITSRTVYDHLESLMEKFDVRSFHRLLQAAVACGLLAIQHVP